MGQSMYGCQEEKCMNAATFMAFAKPHNLFTVIYVGQSSENSEVVVHKALDIIDHLLAEDDYKDMLRKTLSVWTTEIWKKVIFEDMIL
jgi:hypothetical protein